MLENLSLSDSEDFSVDFPHEGNWDIRHEIQNIYGRPGCFAVEVGGVRPRVGR